MFKTFIIGYAIGRTIATQLPPRCELGEDLVDVDEPPPRPLFCRGPLQCHLYGCALHGCVQAI